MIAKAFIDLVDPNITSRALTLLRLLKLANITLLMVVDLMSPKDDRSSKYRFFFFGED